MKKDSIWSVEPHSFIRFRIRWRQFRSIHLRSKF